MSWHATARGQITRLTLMEEDQPDLAAIAFPTQVFSALEGSGGAGASRGGTEPRSA